MVTIKHEARVGSGSYRRLVVTAVVAVLVAELVTGTPPAWAQWATSGTSISYTTGSVGIGTASPQGELDVVGDVSVRGAGATIDGIPVSTISSEVGAKALNLKARGGAFPDVVISTTGWVGIGTASPAGKLDVVGDVSVRGSGSTINGVPVSIITSEVGAKALNLRARGGASPDVVISTTGWVGIGTASPAATLHVAGNAQVDGNIAAKYQDVAEWVRASSTLPPGTVVAIDTQESNRIVASNKPYDIRVAGVVSAQPGIVLGEPGENKAMIAHSGRVRVKVDANYGSIAVGDLLVTSAMPGYAMRSEPMNIGGAEIHRPGTLLGKALEPLATGQGEILVLLTL